MLLRLIRKTSTFVKMEHTIFSLPLIFAGGLLGYKLRGPAEGPLWLRLALLAVAGFGARTAALAINRIFDRRLDEMNPRTAHRELPTGIMTVAQAWGICITGVMVYLVSAATLGDTALALSPIPLFAFAAYPLLKRFTYLCHFGVGLALCLGPLGGFVGLTDEFPREPAIWWLAGFTACWVAGFDTLYATMDEAFDREQGLHSIPARFGKPTAQDVAMILHALAFLCLASLTYHYFHYSKGWLTWITLLPTGILLALEQKWGYSLEEGAPFFRINAWTGVAASLHVLVGVL